MVQNDSYDEYKDWEKKQNSKWTKISKQIKPVHVIGILLLFFLGSRWVSTGKIQSGYFWVILLAFGLLALFLMFRETNEQKLIPEHIIKQIAYETLKEKRAKGIEIPFDAKVRVTLIGEGIYEQDLASGTSGWIKRDVGFEIIRKGYIKTGVMGIHPYSGIVLGIRWERLGYTGKESKDRIIIPVKAIDNIDRIT